MELEIEINIFAIILKCQYGDFNFHIIWKFVEHFCSRECKQSID